MTINKIAVIGGGLMGRQIAMNTCMYGKEAFLFDTREEVISNVKQWAETYLDGRVKKGRKTEQEISDIQGRFHVCSSLAEVVEGVDCVIEAIVEIEAEKRKLFQELDGILDKKTIIATNSSYMVSSLFADDISSPSRLANMHFYNPALVMKFVEIVKGPHTSEETAQALFEFCTATGKTPILMRKELPGFAANYILAGLYERAEWLVENEYCSPYDVDLACENGLGHPMGPFRLLDLTGIDLKLDIMRKEYEKTGKKTRMYQLYESMVKEGKLGRKSGEGFYKYK